MAIDATEWNELFGFPFDEVASHVFLTPAAVDIGRSSREEAQASECQLGQRSWVVGRTIVSGEVLLGRRSAVRPA